MLPDIVSIIFEYYYEHNSAKKFLETMMENKGELPAYITPQSHVYSFIERQKYIIKMNITILLYGNTINVSKMTFNNIIEFCNHVSLRVTCVIKPCTHENNFREWVAITPITQITKENLLLIYEI
jgi:hypothetical protein